MDNVFEKPADQKIEPNQDPELSSVPVEPPETEETSAPTREEKKRNRYKEVMERAEVAERKAEEAIRRAQEAEARAASVVIPPPRPEDDPLQKEIDATYQEKLRIWETYAAQASANTLTDDGRKTLLKQSRDAEEKYYRLLAKQEQTKNPPKTEDPQLLALRMQYPDVFANKNALAFAYGQYHSRKAINPAKDETVLVAEIMDDTRKQFRMGPHRDGEHARSKDKYVSTPMGAVPGQSSGPKTIDFNKHPEFRRMANAAFSHIPDEKKRLELWAQKAGKKYLELGE